MTSKRSLDVDAAVRVDDFQIIRGIGPGVAQRLHRAGIATFDQLANMLPEQVAILVNDLAGLSAQRIAKQDWIGQARALAAQSVPEIAVQPELPPTLRQHYASFTVELLLDEDNQVRRTRAIHVQTGEEESWAGWQARRLITFFVEHAGLGQHVGMLQQLTATRGEAGQQLEARTAYSVEQASKPAELKHVLRMNTIAAVLEDSDRPQRVLEQDQQFAVRLGIQLARLAVQAPLDYTASIYAKRLDGRPRQLLGEAKGTFQHAGDSVIKIEHLQLDAGTYRLEAVLTGALPSSLMEGAPSLTAMLEGGIIQIN